MKINKLSPDTHDFLQIASGIAKTPKSLYFIGKIPETRQPTVAIVGSRKPTAYGKEVTYRLAYDLAARGIIITSGLALGVDAIAHQAALDADGTTLAVLGNGLSRIYPATNIKLAGAIAASGGALISEYSPDTPARSFQFLERNRIVSALSDAVLITEAASRSGTLNTAAHALEQGRTVFVVPGNITSVMSAGCNQLLKQGATPVTCADDIIDIIAPNLANSQSSLPLGNTPEETKILELLQAGIRDGDELQRKSSIEPSVFSVTLTMLELNGVIRALGANQWTLR
jgi:DNA processing protein